MALKIRLSKFGRKGRPFFRIVVSEARSKRDGKSVDNLGFYNPAANPSILEINKEKYEQWLKAGAKPTEGLRKVLNEKIA